MTFIKSYHLIEGGHSLGAIVFHYNDTPRRGHWSQSLLAEAEGVYFCASFGADTRDHSMT
jgi:hypothetical protein